MRNNELRGVVVLQWTVHFLWTTVFDDQASSQVPLGMKFE